MIENLKNDKVEESGEPLSTIQNQPRKPPRLDKDAVVVGNVSTEPVSTFSPSAEQQPKSPRRHGDVENMPTEQISTFSPSAQKQPEKSSTTTKNNTGNVDKTRLGLSTKSSLSLQQQFNNFSTTTPTYDKNVENTPSILATSSSSLSLTGIFSSDDSVFDYPSAGIVETNYPSAGPVLPNIPSCYPSARIVENNAPTDYLSAGIDPENRHANQVSAGIVPPPNHPSSLSHMERQQVPSQLGAVAPDLPSSVTLLHGTFTANPPSLLPVEHEQVPLSCGAVAPDPPTPTTEDHQQHSLPQPRNVQFQKLPPQSSVSQSEIDQHIDQPSSPEPSIQISPNVQLQQPPPQLEVSSLPDSTQGSQCNVVGNSEDDTMLLPPPPPAWMDGGSSQGSSLYSVASSTSTPSTGDCNIAIDASGDKQHSDVSPLPGLASSPPQLNNQNQHPMSSIDQKSQQALPPKQANLQNQYQSNMVEPPSLNAQAHLANNPNGLVGSPPRPLLQPTNNAAAAQAGLPRQQINSTNHSHPNHPQNYKQQGQRMGFQPPNRVGAAQGPRPSPRTPMVSTHPQRHPAPPQNAGGRGYSRPQMIRPQQRPQAQQPQGGFVRGPPPQGFRLPNGLRQPTRQPHPSGQPQKPHQYNLRSNRSPQPQHQPRMMNPRLQNPSHPGAVRQPQPMIHQPESVMTRPVTPNAMNANGGALQVQRIETQALPQEISPAMVNATNNTNNAMSDSRGGQPPNRRQSPPQPASPNIVNKNKGTTSPPSANPSATPNSRGENMEAQPQPQPVFPQMVNHVEQNVIPLPLSSATENKADTTAHPVNKSTPPQPEDNDFEQLAKNRVAFDDFVQARYLSSSQSSDSSDGERGSDNDNDKIDNNSDKVVSNSDKVSDDVGVNASNGFKDVSDKDCNVNDDKNSDNINDYTSDDDYDEYYEVYEYDSIGLADDVSTTTSSMVELKQVQNNNVIENETISSSIIFNTGITAKTGVDQRRHLQHQQQIVEQNKNTAIQQTSNDSEDNYDNIYENNFSEPQAPPPPPAPPSPPSVVEPPTKSVPLPQNTKFTKVEYSSTMKRTATPQEVSGYKNNTTPDRTDNSTVRTTTTTTRDERLGQPLATPMENILERTSSHQIHTNLRSSVSKQNTEVVAPISYESSNTMAPVSQDTSRQQRRQKTDAVISQEQSHYQQQKLRQQQASSKEQSGSKESSQPQQNRGCNTETKGVSKEPSRQQPNAEEPVISQQRNRSSGNSEEQQGTILQQIPQQRSRSSRNTETTAIPQESSRQQRSRSSSPTHHKHHHRRTSKTRKMQAYTNSKTKHPQLSSKEMYPSSTYTSSSSSNSDGDEGGEQKIRHHQQYHRHKDRKSENIDNVNCGLRKRSPDTKHLTEDQTGHLYNIDSTFSQDLNKGRQQRSLSTQRLKERFDHPTKINDRVPQDLQDPKFSVNIDVNNQNVNAYNGNTVLLPPNDSNYDKQQKIVVDHDRAMNECHHPSEAVKKSSVIIDINNNNNKNDLALPNSSGDERNQHSEEEESSDATIVVGEGDSLSGSGSEDGFTRALGPASGSGAPSGSGPASMKSSGVNSGLTTATTSNGDNRSGLLSFITGKPLTIEEKVGLMRNQNNPTQPAGGSSGVRQQNKNGNGQPIQQSEAVGSSGVGGSSENRNPYRRQGGHREKTRPTHQQQHEQFTGHNHQQQYNQQRDYHLQYSPAGSQHSLDGVVGGLISSPTASDNGSNHTLGSRTPPSSYSGSGSDNDDLPAHLRHLKGYAAVMKSPTRYPNPNKKAYSSRNDRSQDIAVAMQMHREVSLYTESPPQQNVGSPPQQLPFGNRQPTHSPPAQNNQVRGVVGVGGVDHASDPVSGKQAHHAQYHQQHDYHHKQNKMTNNNNSNNNNDHFEDNHHKQLSDFRSTLRSRRGQGGATTSPPTTTPQSPQNAYYQRDQRVTTPAQQPVVQQDLVPHSINTTGQNVKSNRRRYPKVSAPTTTTSAASSPPPRSGSYRPSPHQPPPLPSDLVGPRLPATNVDPSNNRRLRLYSDQTTASRSNGSPPVSGTGANAGVYSQQQQHQQNRNLVNSPGAPPPASQRTRLLSDQTALASSKRAQKVCCFHILIL